jgi:hypothetical protein
MLSILLIPAYAVADAWAGGSLGAWAKRLDDKLPGRAAFWAGLLVALATGALCAWPAAFVGFIWWLYRIVPPKTLGGSATPVGGRQVRATLIRHLLPLVALAGVYWAGRDLSRALLGFIGYGLAATALAAWYGQRNEDAKDEGRPISLSDNRAVELARGGLFGLAVAVSLYQ